MLPDRITPYDNLDLLPAPDADLLWSQDNELAPTPLGRKGRASNRDINLQEDFNNSQFLQDGMDKDDDLALANVDDLDLDLDFGMDIDERPSRMSIEMGRDAPAPRAVEDDIFSDFDVAQPSKERDREPSMALDFGRDDGVRIHDEDGDIQMGDDDFQLDLGDDTVVPAGPDMLRARISESPLSDIDEEFAKEIELEHSRHINGDMYEPEDDEDATVVRNAPQRSKKRKVISPDEQTMLTSKEIREQQSKHDNILRPQVFLPRDPYLLALMEMQKNGGFVSNIMSEARSSAWAPELKGLLSLEAIKRPNDHKRKRDSGIADMEVDEEQGASKSPRLEINDEEDPFAVNGADLGNQSVAPDGTILDIPADEGIVFQNDDEDQQNGGSPGANFDDTVAPLVHPADSGPVSVGTKHAVHILRDLFGSDAATNADKRKKTSVVFQELLPEKKTTKADATKMFFECLVLATKDAIKVDQPEGSLGGPIRVRGKRGLWGAWAEREAGGEIAEEEEENNNPPMNPEPAIVSGSAAVAVSA